MAAVPRPESVRPRAHIGLSDIPAAIRKLTRRLEDLEKLATVGSGTDLFGLARAISAKINETVEDVFGDDAQEAKRYHIRPSSFWAAGHAEVESFHRGRTRAVELIKVAIDGLREKLADAEENAARKTLRAYQGLDLHPEIERAASKLYQDGHYSTAVEHAVKALNDLVRLRSGLELDGIPLMQKAFSPNKPILNFNDLSNKSDEDEQTGFMMMFSGAVSGLRNPRAHRFIHDDPERALEFIAFASLLAKLLDEAKRA